MGRNTYNGGGTVVHAGSGFFSSKGSKKRKMSGSDEPGPAKAGSICDFGPLRSRKRVLTVVEFPKKTSEQKLEEIRQKEIRRANSLAKSLISRAVKSLERSELCIQEARQVLAALEANHRILVDAVQMSTAIDRKVPNLETIARLARLLSSHEPNAIAHPGSQGKRKK